MPTAPVVFIAPVTHEVGPVGARLTRSEKQLAFSIATIMLKIDPGEVARDRLYALAEDTADVLVACAAMRDAAEHDRVAAALRVLAERRRTRVARREGCICGEAREVAPMHHPHDCPVFRRWDGAVEGPRWGEQGSSR